MRAPWPSSNVSAHPSKSLPTFKKQKKKTSKKHPDRRRYITRTTLPSYILLKANKPNHGRPRRRHWSDTGRSHLLSSVELRGKKEKVVQTELKHELTFCTTTTRPSYHFWTHQTLFMHSSFKLKFVTKERKRKKGGTCLATKRRFSPGPGVNPSSTSERTGPFLLFLFCAFFECFSRNKKRSSFLVRFPWRPAAMRTSYIVLRRPAAGTAHPDRPWDASAGSLHHCVFNITISNKNMACRE